MKKEIITKYARCAAALLLTVCLLSSCSRGGNGDTDTSNSDSSTSDRKEYTLRLGVCASGDSSSNGSARIDLTAAVLICDKDGKIAKCYIDCAENTMSVKGGSAETDNDYRTKREMGDDYKMKSASKLGKEWYEQAEYFDNWAQGKTKTQIEELKLGSGGSAEDTDLSAGCTVSVSDIKEAVLKAFDDSRAVSFSAADACEIRFAALTDDSKTQNATDTKKGTAAMTTTFAALAVTDGRISAAVIDTAEPKLPFSSDGSVDQMDYSGTKRELGNDYGMKAASKIGKEWYEQQEFFCNYIKGMTEDEVDAVSTDADGKPKEADLSSGCTVAVKDYITAVKTAMKGK